MNEIIDIEKIVLSNDGVLYVKPIGIAFERIYRSAMGVYWSFENNSLYVKAVIQANKDLISHYELIKLAVLDEYGITLRISSNTLFTNISDAIRNLIMLK